MRNYGSFEAEFVSVHKLQAIKVYSGCRDWDLRSLTATVIETAILETPQVPVFFFQIYVYC
jgi:hypothetical protein